MSISRARVLLLIQEARGVLLKLQEEVSHSLALAVEGNLHHLSDSRSRAELIRIPTAGSSSAYAAAVDALDKLRRIDPSRQARQLAPILDNATNSIRILVQSFSDDDGFGGPRIG